MRKKLKSIIALTGAMIMFGMNLNVYAANASITDILPEKVIDISNGSNDIYGTGVPFDEIYETGISIGNTNIPSTKFVSGGINHTHQYIVSNAVRILQNDKGNSIFNDATHLENLLYFTDWPDEIGNETDYGTFAGHFYDPDTGKNWMGNKSPTAKSRAESYYNEAVNAYKAGKVALAIRYIGIGSHYVSDLNEPHHASNLTALNSNHTEFEKYVDNNRTTFKINNYTLADSYYLTMNGISVDSFLQSSAVYSKGLASKAQNTNTYYEAAQKSVEHAIINVTQYYYKFGKDVGMFK